MHLRGPNRVNVKPPAKVLLNERLRSCPSASESTITEANQNAISWIQVTVMNVDNDGLLERPLMALLVKLNSQRLHRGRGLPWEQPVRYIFGANVVVFCGI